MQEELPEANFAGLLVPEVRLGTLVGRAARVAGIYEPETFRLLQEIRTRKGGLFFGTFPGSMVKKGDWAALIKTHVQVLAS
jgi:predicted deacylase